MTGKRLILGIAVLVLATGCARLSESRLNPFNWFGGSEPVAANSLLPDDADSLVPRDSSVQIPDLLAMTVDRMPGGAIVTAEGVTLTQGFWEPRLVDVTDRVETDGRTLVLDFRVQRPYSRQPAGAQPTRTVSAGVFLSDAELRGITRIIVRGANTQRVARR